MYSLSNMPTFLRAECWRVKGTLGEAPVVIYSTLNNQLITGDRFRPIGRLERACAYDL
jgi:hypothetical protein